MNLLNRSGKESTENNDKETGRNKSKKRQASATPRKFSGNVERFLSYCENGLNTFESLFNVIMEHLHIRLAGHEHTDKEHKLRKKVLRILIGIMMLFPFIVSLFYKIYPRIVRTFRIAKVSAKRRKVSKYILAHAAPISVFALAIGVFAIIGTIASYDIEIAAYVDGTQIGYIDNRLIVTDARCKVESQMSEQTGANFTLQNTVTYKFKLAKAKPEDKLSAEDVYSILYTEAMENYCQAFGLFIDGTLVAANQDYNILEDTLDRIREDITEENDGTVRILNDISIAEKLYPKNSLKTADDIYLCLARGTSLEEKLPKDEIFQIFDEDADKYFAPNLNSAAGVNNAADSLGNGTVSENASSPIVYQTVKTEVVTVPYAYSIIYVPDPSMYVGTYKTKSEGADGEKAITYEVLYIDGVETSRSVIGEFVTAEPVDKVIYEGTKELPKTASKGYYEWPLKTYTTLTDSFGWRVLNGVKGYHTGLDIAAPLGTPVYAADGGLVIEVNHDKSKSKGIYVFVKHDNGNITTYCHLSATSVTVGERVYQGQKVGEVGSTGRSTGPHLHFEINVKGTYQNPMNYLPKK